jgi:signal transduction histidine kinase
MSEARDRTANSVRSRRRSERRGQRLAAVGLAEQRERTRIAGEVHDDTAQVLGAMSLKLERIGEQTSDEHARAELREASTTLREAHARLRLLIFELLPPQDDGDLHASVASYCRELFADTDVACEVDGEPGALAPQRIWLAYRLAQEALRNVAKHARATRVRVSFGGPAETLALSVSDDGVGLPAAEELDSPLHVGLRLLRQRAESAGGSVSVGRGIEGRGVSVSVELPRQEAADE